MTPQLIGKLEDRPVPHCTREQARELLEGLRAAYQSLSPAERNFVTCIIWQAGRAQLMREMD